MKDKIDSLSAKVVEFQSKLDETNRNIAKTDLEKTQLLLYIKEKETALNFEKEKEQKRDRELMSVNEEKERLLKQVNILQRQSAVVTEATNQRTDEENSDLRKKLKDKEAIEADLRKKVSILEAASKSRVELDDLSRTKATMQAMIDTVNNDKQLCEKELRNARTKIAQLGGQVQQLSETNSEMKLQIIQNEAELNSLRLKAVEIKHLKKEHEEKVNEYEERVKDLMKDIQKYTDELERAKKQLNETNALLQYEMGEKIKNNGKIRRKNESLEKAVHTLKTQNTRAAKVISDMTQEKNELNRIIGDLQSQIMDEQSKSESLSRTVNDLKAKIEELTHKHNYDIKSNDVKNEGELMVMRTKNEQLQNTVDSLNQQLNTVTAQYKNAMQELNTVDERISSTNDAQGKLKKIVSQLEGKLRQAESSKKALENKIMKIELKNAEEFRQKSDE